MKYIFRIYDRNTNDIVFETEVEGADKHQCASSAARAGRDAGFQIIAVGKSVRYAKDLGEVPPYKFQLKQIGMNIYAPQERYDAKNTTQIRMKLNVNTDADILEQLASVGNKQGYIKELIRRDILDAPEIFVIRDHLAGNEIERFTTLAEATEEMKNFVRSDKTEGIYEAGFYEIYNEETEEVVAVSE